MSETSTKPYLIRGLHEWCVDNGYTPYIVVQVDEYTVVPHTYVQNGQITLNISPLATSKLSLGNDFIEFEARFGGLAENVAVPTSAISAIYARETGTGMGFEVEAYQPSEKPIKIESTEVRTRQDSNYDNKNPTPTRFKRPHLTIVR